MHHEHLGLVTRPVHQELRPSAQQPVGKQFIERRNLFATTGIRQGIVSEKSKPQSVFDAYTAPFPDKTARYPTWVMPRDIARWHEALGKVPTTRLDDASHFLQEDRPEAIADAIKRLVTQIS